MRQIAGKLFNTDSDANSAPVSLLCTLALLSHCCLPQPRKMRKKELAEAERQQQAGKLDRMIEKKVAARRRRVRVLPSVLNARSTCRVLRPAAFRLWQ
jgi:hypothetical protein